MKKLMIAIAAIAMFASSAYAAEWNFYGNVRFYNFWTSTDTIDSGVNDVDNLSWDISPWSRIGANIKVSDELTARFETDIAGTTDGTDMRIRHLWGEWNFGPGSVRIGQDYAPTYIWGSNQVGGQDNANNTGFELGLGGYGEMGGSRVPQIKLIFGAFHLAFVEPSTAFTGTGTTETTLPGLAASYRFSGDTWNLKLVGAYQSFDVNEEDVNSYLLGIGGDVAFANFTLYASVHGGQNIGNLQNGIASGRLSSQATVAGTNVTDVDGFAYRFVANYKLNDMFSFEIGYGYGENELDTNNSTEDEVESYYVNMPIVLAPGVTVTPEVGIVDEKEAGETDTTYYGLHWRINF